MLIARWATATEGQTDFFGKIYYQTLRSTLELRKHTDFRNLETLDLCVISILLTSQASPLTLVRKTFRSTKHSLLLVLCDEADADDASFCKLRSFFRADDDASPRDNGSPRDDEDASFRELLSFPLSPCFTSWFQTVAPCHWSYERGDR